MARPADVLAAMTKANAALAKPRRVVAELPEGTFEHVRTLAESLPSEADRRTLAKLDRETQKIRQMVLEDRKQMPQTIKLGQLAWIRARVSGSRSDCSGSRSRAPRGRPVRRRGSRRTATATRAGPSDDPGPGEPPRHRRVAA